MKKKILKISAVLLFIWLAPALYLIFIKGYSYHEGGLFYSDREQRKWARNVLDAEDMARLKLKYHYITEEEYKEYLDYLLDSLANNKPPKVYIPFYDF